MYFPQVTDIRPNAKIEDLALLKEIVAKCGYKMRLVANPHKENEKLEQVCTTVLSVYI